MSGMGRDGKRYFFILRLMSSSFEATVLFSPNVLSSGKTLVTSVFNLFEIYYWRTFRNIYLCFQFTAIRLEVTMSDRQNFSRQMSRSANVATGKCRDRQMSRSAKVRPAKVRPARCRPALGRPPLRSYCSVLAKCFIFRENACH